MDRKLKELLSVVEKDLKKAEKNYLRAKKDASEVAATAAYSHSQAGDRFHSEGAADIVKARVDALKSLKEEIESGTPRFLNENGGFYLVKNVTLLPGIKLVSVNSPVGKELLKNVGGGRKVSS